MDIKDTTYIHTVYGKTPPVQVAKGQDQPVSSFSVVTVSVEVLSSQLCMSLLWYPWPRSSLPTPQQMGIAEQVLPWKQTF